MRECYQCGRPLAPGETCGCSPLVNGLPKDGLRAKCPCFKFRSRYRLWNYIVCGGEERPSKTPFKESGDRDGYYRIHCCEDFQNCELYQLTEGEAKP